MIAYCVVDGLDLFMKETLTAHCAGMINPTRFQWPDMEVKPLMEYLPLAIKHGSNDGLNTNQIESCTIIK